MTCQECELLLADGGTGVSLDDHLRGCAACRVLQEDLQANALALSSLRYDELPRVTVLRRRPALPWMAAAAAAALLVLIAHQPSKERSIMEAPSQPQQVTAPLTAKLPPKAAPKLPVRRKPKPAPRGAPLAEPLLVKMLTPDPDVVVYWLVD